MLKNTNNKQLNIRFRHNDQITEETSDALLFRIFDLLLGSDTAERQNQTMRPTHAKLNKT